jgi:large subunit ribosomal protein L15
MIHEITTTVGRHRKRKRVGRGQGSGRGKTCGRGHKGAGSRSGHVRRTTGEGGQMPLFRRLPKVGFTNAPFRRCFAVVNLNAIDARFDDGAEVNPDTLVKVGLLRSGKMLVKILGQGDTKKKLAVTAAAFSASARQKIEQAGGTVTVESSRAPTGNPGAAK